MTDTLSDQAVTEMREKLALAWAEALESGRYQQGYEWLRVGDNYCCLGVLADVAITLEMTTSRWTTDMEPYSIPIRVGDQPVYGLTLADGNIERKVLPRDVSNLMGFSSPDGEKRVTPKKNNYWIFDARGGGERRFEALAEANDSRLVNFDDVAKSVREQYDLDQRETP